VPVTLTWAPHPKPLPLAVAAAFLRGAARMGMDIRVAAPADFALPEFLLDEARAIGPRARVTVFEDQREALSGARAVYAKSWAAPELLHARDADLVARSGRRNWTVSEDLMSVTDDALFLHCLPVRRNVVVDDAVLDGPRSVVVQQAGNRLHTARAVLAHTLTEGLE
jgi:N-acetylornithine carbamoyltransferase